MIDLHAHQREIRAAQIRREESALDSLRREHARDIAAKDLVIAAARAARRRALLQVAGVMLGTDNWEAVHVGDEDANGATLVRVRLAWGHVVGVLVSDDPPRVVPAPCWLCEDTGLHEGSPCDCEAGAAHERDDRRVA